MPSDERVAAALAAVERDRRAFRSAVAATAEEIRTLLATSEESREGGIGRAAAELGPFAAGRLDPGRFRELFQSAPPDRALDTAPMRRALEVLRSLLSRGEELFVISVPSGEDPVAATSRRLADAGRAFGAARVVELVRSGPYRAERHAGWLERFPFRAWTDAERHIAPPLVLALEGADLRIDGLARFLDGSLKLLLVVDGEVSPPAPLARLVTPGVMAVQSDALQDLEDFGAWAGPGVAALVPPAAARFIHRPGGGGREATFELKRSPPEDSLRALGGLSIRQQLEELRHLRRLAAVSAAGAQPGPGPPAAQAANGGPPPGKPRPDDPAALLAAWLLREARLESELDTA